MSPRPGSRAEDRRRRPPATRAPNDTREDPRFFELATEVRELLRGEYPRREEETRDASAAGSLAEWVPAL